MKPPAQRKFSKWLDEEGHPVDWPPDVDWKGIYKDGPLFNNLE